MKRHPSTRLVAVAVALALVGLCAAAYAAPIAWHDLLAQTTGGSFGGSSWGSGASSSGGSSSSSSSSSGGGGGLVEAIVGLVFEILLSLLWQAFVWCLTEHAAPTIAVLATIALFAWGLRAPVESERDTRLDPSAPRRAAELGPDDNALLRDLGRTTELVSYAGYALSGALTLAGVATLARHGGQTANLLLGLGALAVSLAVGVASWRARNAREPLARIVETTGSDLDHLASAARRFDELFAWVGGVLVCVMVTLAMLVLVGVSIGP